jgi:hypothetical protein
VFVAFVAEQETAPKWDRYNLKTAVGGEVLREDVVAAALGGFVKAHLLVHRTKPTSADDITASARRLDSTAVFRFKDYVLGGWGVG